MGSWTAISAGDDYFDQTEVCRSFDHRYEDIEADIQFRACFPFSFASFLQLLVFPNASSKWGFVSEDWTTF